MLEALLDALLDTGKLLPILVLTYLFMEYLEHHAGGRIARLLQRSRGAGPALGAALGLIPQCGFSGAASSLYAAGAITMGTLLAVFLSTSDEMLPILLSAQVPLSTVGVILGIKFLSGAAVGLVVDGVLRFRRVQREPDIHAFCEQEHCSCEGGIFLSALRHTVKIILLIFVVTCLLNLAFVRLPHERLQDLWSIPVLGEVVAAILGLFPNCAASVLLTNLYVHGVMGPGPMLSGLMVNAGVGLLVLFRVSRNKRENWTVVGILLLSGVLLGSILGLIFDGIL